MGSVSSLELRGTIWQQRICCDLGSGMITLTLTLLSFFLVLVQARLDTSGHEPLTFSNDYFHLPDLFDNLFDIEQDQNNGGDLLFPTLNKEQQRFAVNPAYPGYTARVFGNPTDPLNEIDIEANDEVVKDPFFSSTGQDLKKASLNPLVQDPRVLANAIEDKIYDNDIYFTTIVGVTSGLTVLSSSGWDFYTIEQGKMPKPPKMLNTQLMESPVQAKTLHPLPVIGNWRKTHNFTTTNIPSNK